MREDMVDAQRRENLAKPGASKARRVKRSDADHPAAAAAEPNEVDPRFRPVEGDEGGDAPSDDTPLDEGSAPAKKRRRRRRKPNGAGPIEGGGGGSDEAGG